MTQSEEQVGPWVERFEGLARLQPELKEQLLAGSSVVSVPAASVLFGPGQSPENMLFLLDGTVRVQQISDTGREIVLYRIRAGESCVLTTACLLGYDDYSAEGITQTDVVAAAVPRALFDDLVAQSKPFRTFVFAAFSKRITDLFRVIDEVAFQKIDVRLADRLLTLAGAGNTVEITHQTLSVELGSAREVVSRQLQEFHKQGLIEQSRGKVVFSNRRALEKIASH